MAWLVVVVNDDLHAVESARRTVSGAYHVTQIGAVTSVFMSFMVTITFGAVTIVVMPFMSGAVTSVFTPVGRLTVLVSSPLTVVILIVVIQRDSPLSESIARVAYDIDAHMPFVFVDVLAITNGDGHA